MVRRFSIIVAIAAALMAWTAAWAQTPAELLAAEDAWRVAFNSHDMDRLLSYWADDGVFDYVATGTPIRGKEQIRAFMQSVFAAYPDYQDVTPTRLAAGNIIVTECRPIATHQGAWMGIPATGRSFSLPHMSVYEYQGTKIKKLTFYDDGVSLLIQLGVLPVPTLAPLTPSFALPGPQPTGLTPLDAEREAQRRWDTHDLALYSKIIRADASFYIAPLGATLTRDGYIATQEMFFLGFPDLHMEQQRVIDMGDGWVLREAVCQGTQQGPYLGVPPTGRLMTNRVAWVSHYDENGLMTNANFYFDNLGVLVQLGAIQLPGASAVLPTSWGDIKATFQE